MTSVSTLLLYESGTHMKTKDAVMVREGIMTFFYDKLRILLTFACWHIKNWVKAFSHGKRLKRCRCFVIRIELRLCEIASRILLLGHL